MQRICENCNLYQAINDSKGQCNFWDKEVTHDDYCLEYKTKDDEK